MSGNECSAKAIFHAFTATPGIALAKLGAAIYTGSSSMLAESVHSFAGCGNQVLLWVGLRQSQRPPDEQHPLGYGNLTFFWGFIVAIMLFSLGRAGGLDRTGNRFAARAGASILLIGAAAEEGLQRALRAQIERDPAIDAVLNAITLQIGPQVMLAAKIRLKPGLMLGPAIGAINALEKRIKANFPEVRWSFIEPDVID